MNPSDGLNSRTVIFEILDGWQQFKPNIVEYVDGVEITGYPLLPDFAVYKCGLMFMNQLPETV